jgi:hypothetical protein
MPSTLHEALIEIFRHPPSLAAELLSDALGIDLPAYQVAQLVSSEFNDLTPTEYRADAVVVLRSGETAVVAVVIEAQLGRDRAKQWSWPVYLATLRARLRCPTVLLVVCVETTTATWCATPIALGHPGWTLTPLVLGPDRVPVVTDIEEAIHAPELSVLSAMAHGVSEDRDKVLHAMLSALATVEQERAALYIDVVLAALPTTARRYLEALVTAGTYEYQSDFVRRFIFQGRAEGKAEGKAEGEATAVLTVLDARGIHVPDDARTRITKCSDLGQLDTWLRRAATADSIQDLFD